MRREDLLDDGKVVLAKFGSTKILIRFEDSSQNLLRQGSGDASQQAEPLVSVDWTSNAGEREERLKWRYPPGRALKAAFLEAARANTGEKMADFSRRMVEEHGYKVRAVTSGCLAFTLSSSDPDFQEKVRDPQTLDKIRRALVELFFPAEDREDLLSSTTLQESEPPHRSPSGSASDNSGAIASSLLEEATHRDDDSDDEEEVQPGKRKDVLGTLEEMQQSFQAKAQEAEASVEAVQSNLKDAEDKLNEISQLVESARKQLRAQAKWDQLQLEEQAATFRCVQAAADTVADCGRQRAPPNLVSEVVNENRVLEKIICDLKKRLSTAVKHAPTYEISAEKMTDIRNLLMDMKFARSIALSTGPVLLASIQLDPSHRGRGSWLGADQCSLSNQPCPHSQEQPQSQVLRGPASCGTAPLPGTRSYWQLRFKITPKPEIREGGHLCEFGVAPLQALHTWDGRGGIGNTVQGAFTVDVHADEGHIKASAWNSQRWITCTALAPLPSCSPVDQTLGLLLDTATSRLHVIDVGATRVLWSSDIDLSTPVWPVVRVWPEGKNEAEVEVEVQSGPRIGITADLVRLLQCVLGRKRR